MSLRRFASLSLLTATLALLIGGSAGCVVHARGASGHPARSCEHHCHAKVCHAHCHTRGHHP